MLKIREKILPVNLYQCPVTINNTGFKPNFKGLSSDSFNNSTKPLSFESVEDAETYAWKNLKVRADFDGNLTLANLTVDGLNDLKEAGFGLPGYFRTEYLPFKDEPKDTESDGSIRELTAALFTADYLFPTIYLNPKFAWEDIGALLSEKNYEGQAIYSTESPKHFIYHEIGHFLHYKADSKDYFRSGEKKPKATDKQLIKDSLGEYASENYSEFVAECFVAKLLGQKLPPEIDKLYKKWNGPEPSYIYQLKTKLKKEIKKRF